MNAADQAFFVQRDVRAARVATTGVFFLSGAGFANWVVRIPTVQAELSLNERDLGLALLGLAVGAVTMLPFTPALVARLGSRAVVGGAILAYAAALSLPALAPHAPALFLALAVFGAATGALDVAMNAQAAVVEERLARPVMSSFHAAFSLGGLSGAAAGGSALSVGWSASTHLLAVGLLLALAGTLAAARLLVTPPALPPERGGRARARVPRTWLLLGLLAFCAVFTEGTVNDWSAVHLRQLDAGAGGQTALGFAFFSLAMTVGRLFGDPLTARFGAVQVLRAGGLLASLGFVVSVLASTPLVAALGFLLVGLGTATMFPLIISAAGRSTAALPGAAIAFVSVFGYGGFLVGPPLIGLTAHAVTLPVALLLAAGVTLVIASLAGCVRASGPGEHSLPDAPLLMGAGEQANDPDGLPAAPGPPGDPALPSPR